LYYEADTTPIAGPTRQAGSLRLLTKGKYTQCVYTVVVGKLARTICFLMTKEQIKEIAGNLEMGFRCLIHKESLKMTFIPDEDKHLDIEIESWKKELKAINKTRNKYFEIDGMDSRNSFRIIEEFIESVDDRHLQEKLGQAIRRPKPFSNFKFEIDNSGPVRDKWFAFKENKLMEWVEGQLLRIKV
jgi:hypothetical protein